ncbi:hypothetical protein JCM17823_01090 [Halorubrum gandharaense]
MTVIVDFRVPAEDFVLGRALQRTTGLSVELEKMIPVGSATIPYFWVIGEGVDEFEAVLKEDPALLGFTVIDELDGRHLYRAEWETGVDTFVQAVVTHDVVLQEASGDADAWAFKLRFLDASQLSSFHAECRERGVDLEVNRLYNPIDPAAVRTGDLTDEQRTLIEHLYDEGYFEIPRRTTLVDVAEELDLSDQAVNERLRRGLSTLIGATLKLDDDGEP